MKSFKGYLERREVYLEEKFQEWRKGNAPAWTESLSTMLFDLPRAGLKDLKIPLSPSIMSRVWPKSIRSKAFHLTDYDGLGKLKGMQKGKRSISAFYNMDDHIISSGIKTEGGYVVELEGDVLAASPDDISSQPDKSGRRWITFSSLMNPSTSADPGLNGKTQLKGIEKDLENLLVEIINKNGHIDKGIPTDIVAKSWEYLGKEKGGKEKSLIIKDYIDGMEKIMKKYSKKLRSVLTDYTKKRTLESDPDSGDVAMWDELVVNNFTIQKIHVGSEHAEEFQDDDDIDGFPFELWNDSSLAQYISKKSKGGT